MLNQIILLLAMHLQLSALPPLSAADLAIAAIGGGGLVAYMVWIVLLLRRIRPALARRLANLLGVSIEERYRGQWAVAPRGSHSLGCAVAFADIAILLAGTLGPLILLSLALLLFSGP
jgi:hypothetical protein